MSRVDLPVTDEPVAGRSPHLSRRRRRRSAVVPVLLALLTAAALAEAGVDRPVASVAWLAIGPLTASLLLTWTWTALVGGYATLLGTLVVATRPGDPQTAAIQLLVLGALSAFAVGNCVLRERRERQLRTVLRVARVAQGAILQPVPARSSRMHFGARYRSADPQAQVGGDVLDVRPTPRGARVLVADVRGHGLPAVQLAAVVAASFREACARPGLSLVEVARYVDHSVELLASDEESATAVFLDLDDRGWAEVINCGHPPPLRRDPGGRVTALSPRHATTPLGRSPQLRSDTFSMTPHERLVVYTDGLLDEAHTPAGEFMPLQQRVAALDTHQAGDAAARLMDDALTRAGGDVEDDVAILVIDFDPPKPPSLAA